MLRSRPNRATVLPAMPFALLLATLVVSGGAAAADAVEPRRCAILVGCSEFPTLRMAYGDDGYAGIRMAGPENDVAMWRSELIERQGFAAQDIIALSGWSRDDEASRPTRGNIQRAFETTAGAVSDGSLVLVYLASHVPQVPHKPTASQPNTDIERDGFDEILMPADAGRLEFDERKLENGIWDHDLTRWVRELRARGAFVVVIVNAPHAAGMLDLGPETLAKKPLRADTPKSLPKIEGIALLLACAADESPVEMDFVPASEPQAAPRGLFTHVLLKSLRNGSDSPRSYRQWMDAAISEYRAAGGKGPLPMCEGDVEQPVFRR